MHGAQARLHEQCFLEQSLRQLQDTSSWNEAGVASSSMNVDSRCPLATCHSIASGDVRYDFALPAQYQISTWYIA